MYIQYTYLRIIFFIPLLQMLWFFRNFHFTLNECRTFFQICQFNSGMQWNYSLCNNIFSKALVRICMEVNRRLLFMCRIHNWFTIPPFTQNRLCLQMSKNLTLYTGDFMKMVLSATWVHHGYIDSLHWTSVQSNTFYMQSPVV